MYYEFYIDQFFLEHLLTGYLLIAAAVSIWRRKVSWMRMLAASFANAAAATVFVCLGLYAWCFAGILFAGAILFAGERRREQFGGLFLLLLVTVCFGGVLELLLGLFGLPLAAGSALGALLVRVAGKRLARRKVLQDGFVTVRLEWEERAETLRGLVDTGNRLEEPLTSRPVSIVEAGSVRQLLGDSWEERRGFYLIPYHSIGAEKGWLRGVTIDRMTVELSGGPADIRRPVLAIYEGQVSAGMEYQMILHPLHARPGRQSRKGEKT